MTSMKMRKCEAEKGGKIKTEDLPHRCEFKGEVKGHDGCHSLYTPADAGASREPCLQAPAAAGAGAEGCAAASLLLGILTLSFPSAQPSRRQDRFCLAYLHWEKRECHH